MGLYCSKQLQTIFVNSVEKLLHITFKGRRCYFVVIVMSSLCRQAPVFRQAPCCWVCQSWMMLATPSRPRSRNCSKLTRSWMPSNQLPPSKSLPLIRDWVFHHFWHFQARCCKRRLNLALGFCVIFVFLVFCVSWGIFGLFLLCCQYQCSR